MEPLRSRSDFALILRQSLAHISIFRRFRIGGCPGPSCSRRLETVGPWRKARCAGLPNTTVGFDPTAPRAEYLRLESTVRQHGDSENLVYRRDIICYNC